jgi:hypothetical protein
VSTAKSLFICHETDV